MVDKARNVSGLKCVIAALVITTTLSTSGCVSTGSKSGTSNVGFKTGDATESPKRVLSRRDLDHVINAKLSRQEIANYLKNIKIEDYSIQDPNTNWSHASIGSADSRYSIYYLTYRQRYFILLLTDIEDRYMDCIDAITGSMPSTLYEIGMGPVEINHDYLDSGVVVIYNKKWKGNYSDDIVAAFKPNLESKQIEAFDYTYIKIFREE